MKRMEPATCRIKCTNKFGCWHSYVKIKQWKNLCMKYMWNGGKVENLNTQKFRNAQEYVRTGNVIRKFDRFKMFVYAVVHLKYNQKRPIFLHACVTSSELPSIIVSTMDWAKLQPKLSMLVKSLRESAKKVTFWVARPLRP